jgi:hypothetical protein
VKVSEGEGEGEWDGPRHCGTLSYAVERIDKSSGHAVPHIITTAGSSKQIFCASAHIGRVMRLWAARASIINEVIVRWGDGECAGKQ